MKSSKSIVEGYIKNEDWRVKENSNSPFSFGGLNKYITAEVSKDYWLRDVYDEDIAQAYVSGHIHIHDLGGLSLYCCGYSLKDVLIKGVRGVPNIPTSGPAKHFDSVLNQIANLTTIFQNEILGAVAFNSFDTLLAPFIKVDKLSFDEVKQSMQNYIFSINSNSRAGAEPAFSNLTFDLTPPKDMAEEYAIVGGKLCDFKYKDCQNEMDMLNRAFYEVMLEGDYEGKLFAYPIPTYNIHGKFDWDNPNNEKLWEMTGKYGTPYFANFINSDLDISDVRSMCPLDGDVEILYFNKKFGKFFKSKIKDLYDRSKEDSEIYIISNGKLLPFKVNKFNEVPCYEIKTVNGMSIVTTGNHLNKVYGKKEPVQTRNLTTEDYLPVSKKPFLGEDVLTRSQGFIIGAFLGDGSYTDNGVVFSLNDETKKETMKFIEEYTAKFFGAKISEKRIISQITGKDSCVNVYCNSMFLRSFVEQYVNGNNALNKGINTNVYNTSYDFRMGIIEGLYATDGGNKLRIYTSSVSLRDDIVTLLSTLGIAATVSSDDRDGRLGTNPCYTVKWYQDSRSYYGNIFKQDEDYMWFRIKSVENIATKKTSAYCVEILSDCEPVFSLPNGIVTHNCRLRLDLSELRRRNGGLFGSGDSTGSVGVVTINLPRIAYENKGNKEGFYKDLDKYLEIAKNSLVIKREWLQKNILETGAIPAFIEYVGTLNNHFSTIGVVGMNEMCVNLLGKTILDEEGKEFSLEVGNHIRNKLVDFQNECGALFNYEATPAESTCYRLALKDRKDYPDIFTQGEGEDCYYTNSCHIPVNMIETIDKTFKHQEDLQLQFTGGTVIHCYFEGPLSGEQAKQIVRAVNENYRVPYMSISPISRYCSRHGYVQEVTDVCPICGERLKEYQRITGYLRCVDNFNRGKAAEFKDRKQYGTNKD